MDYPIAYHIIWTAYGTWLPGDGRGWVKRGQWAVQSPDPAREAKAKQQMAETAIEFTPIQQAIIESTIRNHCQRRSWTLHVINVRTNHVHVVVTADRDGKTVRDQFKAWCSRKLSDAAGLTETVAEGAGRRRWFTEGGDIEHIYKDDHLENVISYVKNQ